jgi:hypothetical protein
MKTRSMTGWILAIAVALAMGMGGTDARSADRDEIIANVPSQWRADVSRVIDLARAEWNDGELLEALEAYEPGTREFRAMCFLIANMEKHLYVDYVNPDDPLNPFSPEEGDIEWQREYIYDYSTITADLLIEDVEWAYVAKDSFPWCRNLPEDVFFDYVLPYRSTQEPLHSWRETMFEELAPMVEGLDSTLDVAWLLNGYNTGRFHFDPLYYRHPEDRDIPTLIETGAGRCEDMSNLSNYSLRAVGVPTTSDFTPWWPKGDNNHAWNVVWNNGRWYSFMGCEAGSEPVWDTIKNRPFAKVYRESYSTDPIMGPAPDGTMAPRLMRVAAIDVTAEYTTVSDIEIDVDNPSRATYLCVFNYGAWRAVAGAWAEDDVARFTDVGNDESLYCATEYIEDESGWGDHHPVALPFVLHTDGSVTFIDAEPALTVAGDVVLTGWNSSPNLEGDQDVYLFRFIDSGGEEEGTEPGWQLIGTVQSISEDGVGTAVFPDAGVDGGLYILSDSDDPEAFREGSRPFVWTGTGPVYY